jgi:hypothetical protein
MIPSIENYGSSSILLKFVRFCSTNVPIQRGPVPTKWQSTSALINPLISRLPPHPDILDIDTKLEDAGSWKVTATVDSGAGDEEQVFLFARSMVFGGCTVLYSSIYAVLPTGDNDLDLRRRLRNENTGCESIFWSLEGDQSLGVAIFSKISLVEASELCWIYHTTTFF